MLTRLLRHVSTYHTPCVILGDFKDVFHHQLSATVSIMSRFNFRQLVTAPTTVQGTPIDHMYYSGESADRCVVHVKDTYYFDHDTANDVRPGYNIFSYAGNHG